MNSKILATGLGIIINIAAIAQGDFRPGYIIKNNNDSVPGLVDYRRMSANYNACFFKESKRSKKQKLYPNDLKAYGFVNDKRYESKVIEVARKLNKMHFFEVLVKGSASLYLHSGIFYLEKDSLVKLPKNDSREIETEKGRYMKENKAYIGILNAQIFDCSLSANKTKYDQKELINLIQNYNRCKGSVGLVFKKNLPWTKLDFQLFTGLSSSNLRVDGFDNSTFGSSRTIIGGGSVDFSSPRLNSKTFFSVEAWYVNNLYQGYNEVVGNNSTTRNDIIINTSFLKLPIGIRYNFLEENQTPYVKVGLVQYFKLTSTLKILSENEVNGVVSTSIDEDKLNGKNQQGYWISVGYTKVISSHLKVFSELRYEKTNGFLGALFESNSEISNFNFLLGLRF